ncbi:MAG: glycosyltransferase [Planctomycetes bacterium]|nr:glycosyltransferase [Planctomycetota bacterium]
MRILLQSRANLFAEPGGDTRQVMETLRALRRRGVRANVALGTNADLSGVDLVHCFNLTRAAETLQKARQARRRGVPCVVTAIHHDLREYNRLGRVGLGRWAFHLAGSDDGLERLRAIFHAARGAAERAGLVGAGRGSRGAGRGARGASTVDARRRAAALAARVIFHCEEERAAFEAALGPLRPGAARIVPLGISEEFVNGDPARFRAWFGAGDFVLAVGRVEDLKNQCAVLDALGGTGLPALFVGEVNRRHRWYARRFFAKLKETPNARHAPRLPPAVFTGAFAAARVHVLASWSESAGLVSLEAGAAGARVVTTARSFARAYLGNDAWHCDPASVGSIRAALLAAWRAPEPPPLKARLYPRFSWENAAAELARVYEEVLGE